MRTLQEKYNAVLEGKFSKTQFRRDAAIEMPQFVSTVNSFDDTVSILKNKGAITEVKKEEPKYSTASPADTIAPDVLDTGIKFELDKKYGTLDVTPEQYEKCREMAIKNLSKDVLYYVKQDSVQLDAPGEKMEKAKLNEGFLDRFKKEPAQSSPAPAKVLSADEIQAMIDAETKTGTIGDILDAAVVQQTIDLKNATPEQIKMLVSVARKGDSDIDTVTGDNYISYLEKLPNFTNDANEAIQNIENDDHTKRRIAGLTNQLLKDVDPRDEDHAVKAYAISVKNDLESGDASRLKRYKDLLSIDDLKDDMKHYISHDVDQLGEKVGRFAPSDDDKYVSADGKEEDEEYIKYRKSGGKVGLPGMGIQTKDLMEEEPVDEVDNNAKLAQLQKHRAQIMRDMEQEAEPEGGPIADKYGEMLNKIDKAIAQLQGTKKEKEYKLMREKELEERAYFDPYDELEERRALKEMFKKIITKVIND